MIPLKAVTDYQSYGKNKKIESKCNSIAFKNQSSDDRDSNGLPIGYRLVINNCWELLPGESHSINQNIGFEDATIYDCVFVPHASTPPTATKQMVVARVVNTIKC